jgi:hypothetical protein
MGALDKATRGQSIPMNLQPFGFNSNENSDTDITSNTTPGDLRNLIGITGMAAGQNPIRFARPFNGSIERAFLSFNFSYIGNQYGGGSGIYIGRGLFNDGTTGDPSEAQVVIDDAQIMADHKLITGSAAPIYPFYSNRQYVIDRLDISKLIANRGGPALPNQYRDYGFIIVIMFIGGGPMRVVPSPNGWPYHLWDLRVEGSALFEV